MFTYQSKSAKVGNRDAGFLNDRKACLCFKSRFSQEVQKHNGDLVSAQLGARSKIWVKILLASDLRAGVAAVSIKICTHFQGKAEEAGPSGSCWDARTPSWLLFIWDLAQSAWHVAGAQRGEWVTLRVSRILLHQESDTFQDHPDHSRQVRWQHHGGSDTLGKTNTDTESFVQETDQFLHFLQPQTKSTFSLVWSKGENRHDFLEAELKSHNFYSGYSSWFWRGWRGDGKYI